LNLNTVLKRQTQNACGGKLNTLRIYIVSAGHDDILDNNNIICHSPLLVPRRTPDNRCRPICPSRCALSTGRTLHSLWNATVCEPVWAKTNRWELVTSTQCECSLLVIRNKLQREYNYIVQVPCYICAVIIRHTMMRSKNNFQGETVIRPSHLSNKLKI